MIKILKAIFLALILVSISHNFTDTAEARSKHFKSFRGHFMPNLRTAQPRSKQHSRYQRRVIIAQSQGRIISPTAAVRAAMRVAPGSKVVGVQRNRRGYVIRLRKRGKLRRVTVDGRTGRVK